MHYQIYEKFKTVDFRRLMYLSIFSTLTLKPNDNENII